MPDEIRPYRPSFWDALRESYRLAGSPVVESGLETTLPTAPLKEWAGDTFLGGLIPGTRGEAIGSAAAMLPGLATAGPSSVAKGVVTRSIVGGRPPRRKYDKYPPPNPDAEIKTGKQMADLLRSAKRPAGSSWERDIVTGVDDALSGWEPYNAMGTRPLADFLKYLATGQGAHVGAQLNEKIWGGPDYNALSHKLYRSIAGDPYGADAAAQYLALHPE